MKCNPASVKLIIGLGNPDRKYANTYHNAGFLLVDFLSKNVDPKPKLLKNAVYMNESGAFVKKIMKKHGLKPEELLVAHDDSDILLGAYKLNFGRGSAGHKGAESVIKALKTKNFWRLRLGVRKKTRIRSKAAQIVLKNISAADKQIFEGVFAKIVQRLT